jgi:tRNA1Val (adenine37-N6)-methyltransferase
MNETLEDLQCKGMKLIQDRDGFRFGTDAVLLADFAKKFKAENMLDLCCGNGIIPILMAAKTDIKKICGIEIQHDAAELAKRSAKLNKLENRIEITEGDLKDCLQFYNKRSFDMITCNPPYMKSGSAIVNECDAKTIARHEIKCTLRDVIRAASDLLNLNGRFFMVHRPSRLAEVISCMKEYKIEPKRLRFIFPDEDSEPVLFLAEGLMFAKEDVRIMPPLFLKDGTGAESAELKSIYGRKN